MTGFGSNILAENDLKKHSGLWFQSSNAGASKRGDRGGETGGGNLGKN